MIFGFVLKLLMQINNKTLDDVSNETGISRIYIHELTSGKKSNPSPEIIHKLSEYFKVDASILFKVLLHSKNHKSEEELEKFKNILRKNLFDFLFEEDINSLKLSKGENK